MRESRRSLRQLRRGRRIVVSPYARVRRASGTRRSTPLPEALQFLRELLPSRGPVGADVLAQLGDIALDVQLVLL
jgi:hypothetical protein